MMFRIYHVRFGAFFDLSSPIVTGPATRPRIVWVEVRMKQLRELGAVLVLAAAIFSPGDRRGAGAGRRRRGLPDLVGALKATPGVLGVDAGQMMSGKQVIFAWFENKQAVLNWYNSDVHRRLMNGFSSGGRRPDGPLAGIKDDSGPILAIASITIDRAAMQSGDLKGGTSQIAIELYAPLPGRPRGRRPLRAVDGEGAGAARGADAPGRRRRISTRPMICSLKFWTRMAAINAAAALTVGFAFNGVTLHTPWRKAAEIMGVGFLFSSIISSMCALTISAMAPTLFKRVRFPFNWTILMAVLVALSAIGSVLALLVLLGDRLPAVAPTSSSGI